MYTVGISTISFNPVGSMIFEADQNTDIFDYKRRISVAKTLDGGSVVIDSGYSDTDRTISIDLNNVDYTLVDNLRNICQTTSKILLFLNDGAYKAVVEEVNANYGSPSAKINITGNAVLTND